MSVKYDAKAAISMVSRIASKLKNSTPALKIIGDIVVQEATENFGRQGYNYGSAWVPLSAYTRMDRARKGFPPNRPILIRTGKLKKGTRVLSVGKSEVIIVNSVKYASTHQYGNSKRHVPVRTILSSSPKSRNAMSVAIINYIFG